MEAAETLFEKLTEGGEILEANDELTRVALPDGAGQVGLRFKQGSQSKESVVTIDVRVPGISFRKVKYEP